jgi:hypothetical protein
MNRNDFCSNSANREIPVHDSLILAGEVIPTNAAVTIVKYSILSRPIDREGMFAYPKLPHHDHAFPDDEIL